MRRHLAGARPVGRGQPFGADAEQVVRAARAPEQALLRGGVRLDRAIDQNVPERKIRVPLARGPPASNGGSRAARARRT